MHTAVHLVAAPWADPLITPIQTSCLKSWLDQELHGSIDVHTYAPFLEVPIRVAGAQYLRFHRYFREMQREALSELAFQARYGEVQDLDAEAERIDRAAIQRALDAGNKDRFPVDAALVTALGTHICDYVDEVIVPNLVAGVNIVGFTLNFNQTYPSILIARHILERAPEGAVVVLVYGGGSVAHPHFIEALRGGGMPGLVVLGEGEGKLLKLVETCRSAESAVGLIPVLENRADGVFSLDTPLDLYIEHPTFYKQQIRDLNRLPIPDYRQYFERLDALVAIGQLESKDVDRVQLAMEGTRGCFAHCDFCSLNRNWLGFRSKAASRIRENLVALIGRHGKRFVYFMDNVCDSWAESFSDLTVAAGETVTSLMEMRAHHDESFWTKLASAGLAETQIGVEALSGPLLKEMAKGTTVIQNVRALKCLTELGVTSTINSNIMTHHPRSTLDDVRETRRVLERTFHFGKFQFVRFRLEPGCPLFSELTDAERRAGSSDQRRLGVERRIPLPARWSDPATDAAWDELWTWYHAQDPSAHEARVIRGGPSVSVVRARHGCDVEEHVLSGALATVFHQCHDGPKSERLVGASEALRELVSRRLVIRLGDHFLSLPLRPREELIDRLAKGGGERHRRRLALAEAATPG